MKRRRRLVWLGVAVALVLGAILLAGPSGVSPSDPRGLNGLAGLKRLLTEAGGHVRSNVVAPSAEASTFVLPVDLRSPDEERRLLDWAAAGGTLVVADPASAVMQIRGIDSVGETSPFGPVTVPPGCAVPFSADVHAITIAADDALLTEQPSAVSCFARGDAAFALQTFVGRGSLVTLGGMSPFYNRYLASHDAEARADDGAHDRAWHHDRPEPDAHDQDRHAGDRGDRDVRR